MAEQPNPQPQVEEREVVVEQQQEAKRAPKLRYLDFVHVAAAQAAVCLAGLYGLAKDHAGPLRPGVDAVESAVKGVVGPVYDRFHGVPLDVLAFVDRKVDDTVHELDKHLPGALKAASAQAYAVARGVPEVARELAAEAQQSGVKGAARAALAKVEPVAKDVYGRVEPVARDLYVRYEPAAEHLAVSTWRSLNGLPVFPHVAQIVVPTAAYWADKYNKVIASAAEQGYTGAKYLPAQIQLPDTMPVADKLARADDTIQEMGLTGALDTRVGGRETKGISGGQKKRLSICLEILTRPRLLFLDEPTSGLDSAASFHVMSRIASLAATDGMTVVAVVHQPCSEVFELFHGLCLLASGQNIYFGPAANAAEFFTLNGYPCPPMRNPSDHFLRTINRDFELESGERMVSNKPSAADEAIETLVNAYKSSSTSENAKREMQDINEMVGGMIRRNKASFLTKVLVLTRRSFVNMYRDVGYYWLRLGIYISISLCLGTIYYNFGYEYDSIRSRSSMLLFTGGLLTLMAIGGFPSFVEEMKIFRRERLNGHYGVAAFVISNWLSATPFLVLIALLPGAIAYYLSGLKRGVDHFMYFALVLCACTMLVEGLMMIVAAIVPDFLMGIITGAGIQGIMMLNCGFFQIPSKLPKIVWKYPMFYISFHKYALQGFYKNEFLGLVLENSPGLGEQTITGEQVISKIFETEMGHSKWVDLAVLCGMIVAYRLIFVVIIKVVDMLKPMFKGQPFRCPAPCICGMQNPCTRL